MHEKRNFILVLATVAAFGWMVVAWVFRGDGGTLSVERVASLVAMVIFAVALYYALKVQDKLPDHLGEIVGDMYYGADGLCFMPAIRHRNGQAELCLYYQNRYENPAQAVVHLRPPDDSFVIREGVRDIHFAFKAAGGDFGVIHQPIAVPKHLQGDVIDVQLAAATFYPRSHGARLRRHEGMKCGTLLVDWGGAAFKTGVHEVSGEIELKSPTVLHLAMPKSVRDEISGRECWRQERIEQGVER